MIKRLPSLTSLRAFEAAARHLSFTRAALELNLTQTAISHQIKTLERLLGAVLFSRDRNGIHLTTFGNEYLSTIKPALFQISIATTRAGYSRNENVLRIASLGTFAIKCLVPKLHKFRKKYPKISIHLTTTTSFRELLQHDYDIEIRYGSGDWKNMSADRISEEEVFPICSPRLLKSGSGLRTPDDLRFHTIIRTESDVLRDYWQLWFETARSKPVEFANEITCNSLSTTIQAAADSLGVALARSTVTKDDLAAGRLVEPFGIRLACPAEGYYVVVSPEFAELQKVKAFRNWILETFR
jgi:LysR family transcriptional regulator, glycine cleavage system transcriptional activator